jgi:hypothetical protein
MGQIFLGQNSQKMMQGIPDGISMNFDWVITANRIFKNEENPKTIYMKTDFLPMFVSSILPTIKNEFVLITGCSDYSPEVNFNREYNVLINYPLLKYWYMSNMRTKTPKSSGIPCGLSNCLDAPGKPYSTDEEVDQLLLTIRNQVNKEEKIDKVFCCFRNRDFNVCGQDMIIRPKILQIIKDRTDIFDFYETNSLDFENFIKTMSKYKYSLCTHGNGMDPNPTSLVSHMVYTTPVVYKTPNSVSIFEDTDSVIFFEDLEQVIDKSLYKETPYIDYNQMTNSFWVNKIKSHIS